MKKLYTILLLSLSFILLASSAHAQGSETYTGGLKVKLNQDGSKYVRFITWHQAWLSMNTTGEDFSATPSLRRSRVLMFAQVSPRFLILTHFGLNSLNSGNMDPVGKSASAQLFMHDAWVEYTVAKKKLHIGAGLHYWHGPSRLSGQSTLNMLTLDAPRFNWASIGLSDQFARHLGIYAKGKLGKFEYRLSLNEGIKNTLDANAGRTPGVDEAVYVNDGTKKVLTGYFNYQFLDQESNLLPYYVGTYVGTKKVFNIGVGFHTHFKGTQSLEVDSSLVEHDVLLLSADVFYDSPLGDNGSAITAYAAYYNFNFGPNYLLGGSSDVIGTGNIVYAQVGYLTPKFSEKVKVQPYASFSNRGFEAFDGSAQTLGVGSNFYLDGHNCKVTVEYQYKNNPSGVATGAVTLQGMIYL